MAVGVGFSGEIKVRRFLWTNNCIVLSVLRRNFPEVLALLKGYGSKENSAIIYSFQTCVVRMKFRCTTFANLLLSCDLQRHLTVIHKSSHMASWDNKVSI